MAEKRKIMLALQGGGAHGAITWGVLDRLLEEEDLEIAGVSGTSAGAMNAAVMSAGLEAGGRDAARANLERFWKAVSDAGNKHPGFGPLLGNWMDLTNDYLARYVPLEMRNPFNLDPLRKIVDTHIDFSALKRASKSKLFVAATDINDGTTRIFDNATLSADALMASAALPTLFRPVKIGGKNHWDGGYRSNPPLFPLVEQCESNDLLVVHLNPFQRETVPHSPLEIVGRENELNFNHGLQHELGSIMMLKQFSAEGRLKEDRFGPLRMHLLNSDEDLERLKVSGKLDTKWRHLLELRAMGRESADRWLRAHARDIGQKSTFDPTDIIGGSMQIRPGIIAELEAAAKKQDIERDLLSSTVLSSPAEKHQPLLHDPGILAYGEDRLLRDAERRSLGGTVVAVVQEDGKYRLPRNSGELFGDDRQGKPEELQLTAQEISVVKRQAGVELVPLNTLVALDAASFAQCEQQSRIRVLEKSLGGKAQSIA